MQSGIQRASYCPSSAKNQGTNSVKASTYMAKFAAPLNRTISENAKLAPKLLPRTEIEVQFCFLGNAPRIKAHWSLIVI